MGKEENLCGDSVFIRAFDDAISKYKAMHGQTIYSSSAKEGEVLSGSEKNLFHILDKSHEPSRGEDKKSNIESNNGILEVGETRNMSPIKENISVEPCVEETQKESVEHSNLNLKGAEDYNQLLNEYYELEEKRQKVLEQLYQYGGWNYQDVSEGCGSGVEWGVSSTYKEHPVSANETSHKHVLTSCCPSSYPIAAGHEKSSLADGDIIKTAMDAAERAISSMKTKLPGDYDVNKDILWNNLLPRNSKTRLSHVKQPFMLPNFLPFTPMPYVLHVNPCPELCLYGGKGTLIQTSLKFQYFYIPSIILILLIRFSKG